MGLGKRIGRRAAMASSCAVMALAMPALAQDAETDEEAANRPGSTIIVTAERRATSLQETPLSIIAMTNEMVEAKGIEDLQDLARFTPNLSITPARGAGNNDNNNIAIIEETLALRAEKARLLGYDNFAAYKLAVVLLLSPWVSIFLPTHGERLMLK